MNDLSDTIDNISNEELLNEIESMKSKYIYLAADFDNYKKRTKKAESVSYDRAYETVVTEFLKSYDDMERLYKEILERNREDSDSDISPIDSGFELIFENFEKTLISLGCEKIECNKGDRFDVNYMEAISSRENIDGENYETDDVVEIFQSGWRLNGKVIRPVKVVVGT